MPGQPDRTDERRQGDTPPKVRRHKGGGIFISYRREDASGFAGRLHEDLARHFGPKVVFRDVDSISSGADFPELIDTSLETCGAFVVVIGREWLVDNQGRHRLDNPKDWVRIELEAALRREELLIVPVLVENARVPSADELPASLAPLVARNALEVSDSRWDYDVRRLTTCLEGAVGRPATTWPGRVRRLLTPTTRVGAIARIATAAAVLVAVVLGVLHVVQPPGPSVMTGDYNIAVAQFAGVDSAGRPARSLEARALAQSVYDVLHNELASIEQGGFDLNLRAPAETGSISGSTPQRRAAAAATEARQIHADVIVYGTLRVDVPNQFAPEFFLSDRQLQNAEELFGQHELGSVIRTSGDISRNPVIRKELRDQILDRAHALAEFIVGLSYYGANQAQPAFDHFEAARKTAGWDDSDGKEVLYLFLGNAAGKLGRFEEADGFYTEALALNPEYTRARLGRAEVLLHNSQGNCEAGQVDVGGLNAALDSYRRALSAKAQPALSDIGSKVIFGEGRVHLCLSQALAGDYWADAEREFQQVINQFRAGNGRLREMAAESYADLGFVHLPSSGDQDAADRYRRAAADYQTAIDLTPDDDRKAFFFGMRGFIFTRLGDPAKADDAYASAIRLARDPAARARYEEARRALAAKP